MQFVHNTILVCAVTISVVSKNATTDIVFVSKQILSIFVSRYQMPKFAYIHFNITMNGNIQLNEHNKQEYPPIHKGELDVS